MAFKKTLAQRFYNISKISNQILTSCRISSASSARQAFISSNQENVAPDPGDDAAAFRRFLQTRMLHQSATLPPELRSLPTGPMLLERLRGVDITRDRIRLDGLIPPPARLESESTEGKLTVEDARKVLRLSQIEAVKSKLRQVGKSCVSYAEFVQICVDGSSSRDQGLEFAKSLDESGTVIVLGNVVFLKPHQGK